MSPKPGAAAEPGKNVLGQRFEVSGGQVGFERVSGQADGRFGLWCLDVMSPTGVFEPLAPSLVVLSGEVWG